MVYIGRQGDGSSSVATIAADLQLDRSSRRPRKLSEEEHERLIAELQESPEAAGFDRQAWFPRLVYHHLQSEYGVEYSLRHILRLMGEAGLSWRTARPTRYAADLEQAAEFQEMVKKRLELIGDVWTLLAADQFWYHCPD